ncbi:hypothetical protein AB6A40_002931 [Gnathostoma spinigerum]|uniref:Uncharacterized protein n=1 Tax=Gnathostoma spinigerum TaxID=75299 RepID=A0ABD6EI24_9BILA
MENSSVHHKRTTNGGHRRHGSRGSPSRDDEREKRHRKSHKRRHRRSHSRSRSRSRSSSQAARRASVVYMNPAFQQLYGSISGPSQNEFELRSTLVSQLSSSEQRIFSLESELKAAQLARGRAEQTVFDVNAEKLRLETKLSEAIQVMRTLERAVEDLQKENNVLKAETDRRRRDYDSHEMTITSMQKQKKILDERNMKLVKKCEELSMENKVMLNRRDESAKELAELRPRMEGMQMELRQRIDDGRKMVVQLRSFEEKERIWQKEKQDLEKRIEIKDAVAIAERKNTEEWKKKQLAEKAELERQIKLAEPEIRRALDIEAINKAIEDVREFYEQKLATMLNEVEVLRKKCLIPCSCSTSINPSNRPPIDADCRPSSAPSSLYSLDSNESSPPSPPPQSCLLNSGTTPSFSCLPPDDNPENHSPSEGLPECQCISTETMNISSGPDSDSNCSTSVAVALCSSSSTSTTGSIQSSSLFIIEKAT